MNSQGPRPQKIMDWLPISTAPRDGTRILLAIEGVDRAILGYWNGASFSTIDGNDWEGRAITDWLPLPSPPYSRGRQAGQPHTTKD